MAIDYPNPIGESPVFQAALEQVSRLAAIDRPLLIIGERGTGKELVARRLHALSARWDKPLVTLNCAALAPELLDSELFGHEAGAFTGATRRRLGRLELADGGTLFLDEIGNAPLALQEKLLRVLEYGQFDRVGAEASVEVNLRVVAATHEDLPSLVAQGRFRADLLDRLAFEVVTLPPLRARPGDVAVLARYFGRRMAVELGWERFPDFAPQALAALEAHPWPGNVRELKNAVERSVAAHDDPERPIERVRLDPFVSPFGNASVTPAARPEPEPVPSGDFQDAVAALERRLLEQALAASRYNQRAAARRLGLSYEQLRHLLRKHGLRPRASERGEA